MAHYAFLDENNIVTEVIVGRDEEEVVEGISNWESYYGDFRGQVCKRTSYNSYAGENLSGGEAFRYNYALLGYTFDESIGEHGAFIPPQPFNSWTLNLNTCLWEAPADYPDQRYLYDWDEESLSWIMKPESCILIAQTEAPLDQESYNWNVLEESWIKST
jgi:hypothetical protein